MIGFLLQWGAAKAQESVNADRAAAKPETAPAIRSTTRLVQVSVVVTDKKGEPITGLKKEDFTVLDEGKAQDIAFFSAQAPPAQANPPALLPNVFTNRFDLKGQDPGAVTIVLFDSLNTSVQDQGYVRAQVIKFLKDLKPQDHVAVYALTSELLILHEFTQDASALVNAAAQFKPKENALYDASHPEYFNVPALAAAPGWARFQAAVNQADARIAGQYKMSRAEMTANAFEAIANHVAIIPGRKNLVWVSGSFPLSIIVESILADRPSETTDQYSQEAARALNRVNLAVYPVDATGVVGNAAMDPNQGGNSVSLKCMDCINEAPGPSRGMYAREETLTSERVMADATGGQAFYGSSDITNAMKRAFDDGRYAYTVAFYPDYGKWDGEYRKIKVQTTASGAQLRYRSGYFAEPEHSDSETQAKAALLEAAASSLDATSLGLILTGKVSGAPQDRKLELHIELDPKQLLLRDEGHHERGAVDLYFLQQDAKGETVAAETQRIGLNLEEKQYEYLVKAGLVLARHLTIAPQAAELRVLVRDVSSQALGSVTAPVSAWFQAQGDAAAPIKLEIPK